MDDACAVDDIENVRNYNSPSRRCGGERDTRKSRTARESARSDLSHHPADKMKLHCVDMR